MIIIQINLGEYWGNQYNNLIEPNYIIYVITLNLLQMNAKGVSTLKICEQKLNYLNYSPRTKENYLSHIRIWFRTM